MTKLEMMIDAFAQAMKKKLRQKARAGYSGWDSASIERLEQKMVDHVSRGAGQEVDIANFAAMLWYARRSEDSRSKQEKP
jgi:hypothetical protein